MPTRTVLSTDQNSANRFEIRGLHVQDCLNTRGFGMPWREISKDFYKEFGEYHVCMHWNGETGGAYKTTFLTDRKAIMRDYVLCTPWVDQAKLFISLDDAQAYLDHERSIRPGLYDDWKVIVIQELKNETGHLPAPAIAIIGGPAPVHPEPAAIPLPATAHGL